MILAVIILVLLVAGMYGIDCDLRRLRERVAASEIGAGESPGDAPGVRDPGKAHDPDNFYETVPVERDPHVDLIDGVIVMTAPEPWDFDA